MTVIKYNLFMKTFGIKWDFAKYMGAINYGSKTKLAFVA